MTEPECSRPAKRGQRDAGGAPLIDQRQTVEAPARKRGHDHPSDMLAGTARLARAPQEQSAGAPHAEHPKPGERAAWGKHVRSEVPRSAHGEWEPAADRRDPVDLPEEQAVSQIPELVPVRYGRMLVSPFILLMGRDQDDPLFLQLKEAEASVLEPFVGPRKFKNHGQRVVEGQRLMQAASDIMLGWIRIEDLDGVSRDCCVRQLWDAKNSAPVETMNRPRARSVRRGLRGSERTRLRCPAGRGEIRPGHRGGRALRPAARRCGDHADTGPAGRLSYSAHAPRWLRRAIDSPLAA